jgi:hypothetical protein
MPPTGLSGSVVHYSMVDRRRVGVDVTVDSVTRRRLSTPTPQVNHRADADGRALWKCRRGHIDSYLEPHTMEMTGTSHARRHEAGLTIARVPPVARRGRSPPTLLRLTSPSNPGRR